MIARFCRLLSGLSMVVLLAACGGGGGGGGGDDDFTLARSEARFSGEQRQTPPPSQRIALTVTSSRVAYVGAGFRDEAQPSWLSVNIEGTLPDYDVVLGIVSTDLPENTYTSTLTVGVADAEGNILSTRDIRITYKVDARPRFGLASTDGSIVFGSSEVQRSSAVVVLAPSSDRYTVTSNVAWLQPSTDTYQGDVAVPVTFDATGLQPGTYRGKLTVTNAAAASETDQMSVVLEVVEPELTVPESVTIGGADGRAIDGTPAAFSLATGTAAYPWSAELRTTQGGAWLQASARSGDVGSDGTQITLDADRNLVGAGTWSGSLRLTVDVQGLLVRKVVPVTFRKEDERLYLASDGIAFAKLPSRERLSRSLDVSTTLGRPGVPWMATSDASWLTVTASGVTGEPLVVTANPAGLTPDHTYVARVRLSTSQHGLTHSPVLRVGLWVGSTDPTDIRLRQGASYLVNDPVEPLVYARAYGETSISVHNVYTGTRVRSLPLDIAQPAGMTISSDGTTLFVVDDADGSVVAIDPESGAVKTTYHLADVFASYATDVFFARPNGFPTLFLDAGGVIDVETGDTLAPYFGGGTSVAFSPDGASLYSIDTGGSPSTVQRARISRGVLEGARFVGEHVAEVRPGSNGQDVAVAPDGRHAYAASGYPYRTVILDATTLEEQGWLEGTAYPVAVETSWDGTIAGGSDDYYGTRDIFVYGPRGASKGNLHCAGHGYTSLNPRALRFSGDGLRIACGASGDDRAKLNLLDVPE